MTSATTRSFARPAAAVFGLVYLVLGIAGFFTAQSVTSRVFGLFGAGGVLDIVHTVLGVLGLLAARRAAGALAYCLVLFVGLTGMTAYGVLATAFGTAEDDPVHLGWADNWLHGLTALIALLVVIAGMRTRARSRS